MGSIVNICKNLTPKSSRSTIWGSVENVPKSQEPTFSPSSKEEVEPYPNVEAESPNNWQRWLREKRGLLLKTTAPIIPVGLLALAIIRSCDDAENEIITSPTPTPEPVATATIRTPTPTPSETIIPITETPSPTPQPIIETPTPTPTPEVVKPKNYVIEILPPANPDHPAYERYTIEQTKKIVEDTFNKYPVLGHLKIQIALGGGSWFYPDQSLIIIDRAAADLEIDFLHEYVHSLDWAILHKPDLFQGDQQQNLISERETILADPQIGRSYPSFDRLFSGNYEEALRKFRAGEELNLEDLRVLTSNQADTMWIRDENNPLNPFLADSQLDSKRQIIPIEPGSPEPTNIVRYSTLAEFLNQEKPFLDELGARMPIWRVNLEDINGNIEKYESLIKKINPALYTDQQVANWYNAIRIIAQVRTAERILSDDQQITQLFSQPDLEMSILLLKQKIRAADIEKIGDLLSKYLYLLEYKRLTEESQNIKAFMNSLLQLQINSP